MEYNAMICHPIVILDNLLIKMVLVYLKLLLTNLLEVYLLPQVVHSWIALINNTTECNYFGNHVDSSLNLTPNVNASIKKGAYMLRLLDKIIYLDHVTASIIHHSMILPISHTMAYCSEATNGDTQGTWTPIKYPKYHLIIL